jgi:hypothetical protein
MSPRYLERPGRYFLPSGFSPVRITKLLTNPFSLFYLLPNLKLPVLVLIWGLEQKKLESVFPHMVRAMVCSHGMLNVLQGLLMRTREESQFRSGDTRALLGFSLSYEAVHKRLVIGRNGGGAGMGQDIAMMLHYRRVAILQVQMVTSVACVPVNPPPITSFYFTP